MKTAVVLPFVLLFVSTQALAATTTEITTDSATGSHQSTTVDANGNLKVVDSPDQQAIKAANQATNPSSANTSTTSPGMKSSTPAPGSQSSTAPIAPSLPRPPQPLYGTVGGASVLQTPAAAPAPKETGSKMSSGQQDYPPPPAARANQPIGNLAPVIPGQSQAQ